MRKLPTTGKSYLWIEESDSAVAGTAGDPGAARCPATAWSRKNMVSMAYDVDHYHTDWRAKNLDNLVYRLAVKAPVKDEFDCS